MNKFTMIGILWLGVSQILNASETTGGNNFTAPGDVKFKTVMMTLDNWDISAKNAQFETYRGKKSLYLDDGSAVLKGINLKNVTLEYDVALHEGRGFVGSSWRIQDKKNFEEFYMRTHQSGNPDATQYTPVFNGLASWQLYYGREYSAPIEHTFDQWTHIKITSIDSIVQIFIGDMEKPVITTLMKHGSESTGGMGLNTLMTGAHFADFKYKRIVEKPNREEVAQNTTLESQDKHTITTWLVSDPFNENIISNITKLITEGSKTQKWQEVQIDKQSNTSKANPITNLARAHGLANNADTVFARFQVISNHDQVKALHFGFSDKVRVFLNDNLMYSGDNTYRTRDYRYLGTIGLFDTIYLPLKKGRNEVWLAVTESFGGWGVQARFDDSNGIKILPQMHPKMFDE